MRRRGLSFVEPALDALGMDMLAGLQVYDAFELADRHHPPLNPDLPALVGQLYSRALAADVKLTLMNQVPDDHQVRAGPRGRHAKRLSTSRSTSSTAAGRSGT